MLKCFNVFQYFMVFHAKTCSPFLVSKYVRIVNEDMLNHVVHGCIFVGIGKSVLKSNIFMILRSVKLRHMKCVNIC